MRSPEFYQERLEAVSRSFALCIPQLESPFREQVALAYLLLRVLDTVEDAPFADKREQQQQFEVLRRFLREMPTREAIDQFRAAFPEGLTQGEQDLLGDTEALFEDAHALPGTARDAIFGAIDRMADGMAAYTRRPAPLRLIDNEDVSRYCCIVAGLVGELLTRLWAQGRSDGPPMALAYQFGLFLQKVNILKDQQEDEAAGRFLIPDKREFLSSLRADSEGALAYLRSLPRSEHGYRVFCAWSLMLGAASLSQLDGPKQSRRAQTAQLLMQTAEIAQDDAALGRLFAELMPPLPAVSPKPPLEKPESPEEFRAILAAPLSESELARIGIPEPAPRLRAAR